MATARERLRPAPTYEGDFYGWAIEQARLLREGRFAELDLTNLAEEVGDLAGSELRELDSRLAVLQAHLLKWQLQPEARSRGWVGTVKEQRRAITKLLRRNPSLRGRLPPIFEEAYPVALALTERDTSVAEDDLPATCPFTLDQAMDADFWPGEPWPGFANDRGA